MRGFLRWLFAYARDQAVGWLLGSALLTGLLAAASAYVVRPEVAVGLGVTSAVLAAAGLFVGYGRRPARPRDAAAAGTLLRPQLRWDRLASQELAQLYDAVRRPFQNLADCPGDLEREVVVEVEFIRATDINEHLMKFIGRELGEARARLASHALGADAVTDEENYEGLREYYRKAEALILELMREGSRLS